MPDFPIVDAHVHLYDIKRLSYGWLAGVPAINRTCLLDDYGHSTAEERDRLLYASAKHTAGHRKYGSHLDAWRRYADAFGLARS